MVRIYFCFLFFIQLVTHVFAVDSSIIKVVNHNLGTYSDHIAGRQKGMSKGQIQAAIEDGRFVKERNILLKRYFQILANEDIDIFTLQEVYGFNEDEENMEEGIRSLMKEHLANYQLVEEAKEQGPGQAIILFKKKIFNFLHSVSLPGRTIALLKRKSDHQVFLVVSAHLTGFKINGADAGWMTGDGKEELLELLDLLSSPKKYFPMHKKDLKKAITIIGIDANSPPCGTIYQDLEGKNFQIISERTTFFRTHNFITSCSILNSITPSATAINSLVNGGVRLDYVWVKAPFSKKREQIEIREDLVKQKAIASYELKYYSCEEMPLIIHADQSNVDKVPFSDHWPVFAVIKI